MSVKLKLSSLIILKHLNKQHFLKKWCLNKHQCVEWFFFWSRSLALSYRQRLKLNDLFKIFFNNFNTCSFLSCIFKKLFQRKLFSSCSSFSFFSKDFLFCNLKSWWYNKNINKSTNSTNVSKLAPSMSPKFPPASPKDFMENKQKSIVSITS